MPGKQLLMTFPVTATSHTLADYVARGGYATLRRVLTQLKPEDVTKEVTASGLLGHGGAAFPAGRKWGVVHLNDNQPHYLCANADEGEPGTFKDRWILENAPHLLLESMLIAAYRAAGPQRVRLHPRRIRPAVPAPGRGRRGSVCGRLVRREHPRHRVFLRHRHLPRRRVRMCAARRRDCCRRSKASAATRATGRRGSPCRVSTSGPRSSTTWRRWPTSRGSSREGADAYRKVGTAKCPGTQLVSISGHIAKPGVYEVEYGYPMQKFLFDDCGGMLPGQKLKCIVPGGISTKVLTAAEVEPLTFDHQSFAGAGSSLGSGGMIAIAEGTCMVRLLQVMLRFYHHESCGQCTPCREGMGWLHRIIDRIVAGEGKPEDIDSLYRISRLQDGMTICGMGDAAGYATIGILDKYRDEFEYWIANKRSKLAGNLEGTVHA